MERLPSARPEPVLPVLPAPHGPAGGPDRGDIVLGWLTKLVVIFGLAGIVLFDAISIGVTAVNVADQAAFAAREASETWQNTKDLQKSYLTAAKSAADQNALNVVDPQSFRVDADGAVHLRVTRTATTLVLFRIGPIEDWAVTERAASGRSVGSS